MKNGKIIRAGIRIIITFANFLEYATKTLNTKDGMKKNNGLGIIPEGHQFSVKGVRSISINLILPKNQNSVPSKGYNIAYLDPQRKFTKHKATIDQNNEIPTTAF